MAKPGLHRRGHKPATYGEPREGKLGRSMPATTTQRPAAHTGRVRHAIRGFVRHRTGAHTRDCDELLPNAPRRDQVRLERDLRGFVEITFGVPIADGEMRRENFRSIDSLTDLVEERL